MKARKLVLCILLSVALTVTFIPVMSFAAEGEDEPAVSEDVEGAEEEVVDSIAEDVVEDVAEDVVEENAEAVGEEGAEVDQPAASDGDETVSAMAAGDKHVVKFYNAGSYKYDKTKEEYYLELEHGRIYNYDNYFETVEGGFLGEEDEVFCFSVDCDAGWTVSSVRYSINGTTAKDANYSWGSWDFFMPASSANYGVKVWVNYAKNTELKSVNITINAPLCGTVVKGSGDWGSGRQRPQPSITVPSGSKYAPINYEDQNYGMWYKADKSEAMDEGEEFKGTMKAGKTYDAWIYLQTKTGYTFADNCTLRVTGGKVLICGVDFDDGRMLIAKIRVTAVHNNAHVTVPAGLLKNGAQYDQCKACKAIQNKTVIPGYANYYVKKLKVKKGKKSFTVKWKKQSKKNLKKFDGYQIRYSTAANMTGAKIVNAKKKSKSKKIKKLQKKTRYYVQVRTYTKTGAGVFYSRWSTTKSVKTK